MLKVVGIIIVIFVSTYIGFYKSNQLDQKLTIIRKIIRMFDEIGILLNFNIYTSNEILDHLKKNSELCLLDFFLLNSSIDNINEKISATNKLSDNDKELLSGFFSQLGSTDLQGQIAAIEMYRSAFKEKYKDLKEIKDEKSRLYRSMGFLVGAFICIILI